MPYRAALTVADQRYTIRLVVDITPTIHTDARKFSEEHIIDSRTFRAFLTSPRDVNRGTVTFSVRTGGYLVAYDS